MRKWKKIKIYGYVDAPNYWEAVKAFNEIEARRMIEPMLQTDFVKEQIVEENPVMKTVKATVEQIFGSPKPKYRK